MEGLKILADNWAILVAMICGVAFVITMVVKFMNMPSAKQIENLMEWLKIAVVEAEKALGTGTGSLKLRSVYESAVIAFPWIAKYMTFEKFSELVDVALEWMKEQIEKNQYIKEYIEGENAAKE